MIIIFHSQDSKSAPNYNFTPASKIQTNGKNNFISPSAQQSTINVYTPNVYIENKVAKTIQEDIEFLIDYSGSMRQWITQAQKTIVAILPQIPQSTRVGMRVFGQKMKNGGIKSNNLIENVAHNLKGVVSFNDRCYATEQIVSISSINSNSLISAMNNAQIGSATPLTFALQQTVYADFKYNTNYKKRVILISDGGESCGGDPCAFVRRLAKERNDIQIDVIMINGLNKFKCLAEATNGNFYNVHSFNSFDKALKNSIMDTSAQSAQNNLEQEQPPHSQGVYRYQFISE